MPKGGLGIEDECSSIDSGSSHRRSKPAHLSVDMEESMIASELVSMARTPPHSAPSPSGIHQARGQWGGRHSPKSPGLFPRTTPTRATSHSVDSPAAPYQMKRTGALHARDSRSPGRQVLSAQERWKSRYADEEVALSESGAPTEIMTNRTEDVMMRFPFPPNPMGPPNVKRTTANLMQSLIDETSTNEESTTPSQDKIPLRSLLDVGSSSMSASQTTDSRMETFLQSHGTGSSSRLEQHVEQHKVNGFHDFHPIEQSSLETGNTGQSSLRAETGAPKAAPVARWGGRNATARLGVRRHAATLRGLQKNEPPAPPKSAPTVRYFMPGQEDDEQADPETLQTSSEELTATSASTTDVLLEQGLRRGAVGSGVTGFVRYNQRKTPNVDEVFQRRDSPTDLSNASTLSESDNLNVHGNCENPIQPLFSLDRLDLSSTTKSPIRKFHSQSQDHQPPNTQHATDQYRPVSAPVSSEMEGQDQIVKNGGHDGSVSRVLTSRQEGMGETGDVQRPSVVKKNKSGDGGFEKELLQIMAKKDTRQQQLVTMTDTYRRDTDVLPKQSRWSSQAGKQANPPQDIQTQVPSSNETTGRQSVRDRIKALNTTSSRAARFRATKVSARWKPPTRRTFNNGASANRFVNEEKKDDYPSFVEAGSMEPEDDDDDNRSVKSLRDKFEKNAFSKPAPRSFPDDEFDDDGGSVQSLREKFEFLELYEDPELEFPDDDDDTASVKSLREQLEKRMRSKGGSCDDMDDEGSVRSLRERYEPPKKRESGANVSNLKARFEQPKNVVPQRHRSLPTQRFGYKPPQKITSYGWQPAPHPPTTQLETVQTQPTQQPKFVQDETITEKGKACASMAEKTPGLTPWPSQANGAIASTAKENHNEAVASRSAGLIHWQAPHGQQDLENTRELRRAPEPLKILKSDTDPEANEEEDTLSTHSSRVRGPAPSPFLAMRNRLLNFAKSNSTQSKPVEKKGEKRTPPTMHERLNLWASRHQAAKSTPLAGQEERSAGITNEIVIAPVASYDLSSVADDDLNADATRVDSQAVKAKWAERQSQGHLATTGFFHKTNQTVRNRDMYTDSRMPSTQAIHTPAYGQGFPKSPSKAETSAAESAHKGPGAHWINETGGSTPHLKRNDSRGKSGETEYSDGVTLDASIAEVSNLSLPSAIRSKGSKESRDHMEPLFSAQERLEKSESHDLERESTSSAVPNAGVPRVVSASELPGGEPARSMFRQKVNVEDDGQDFAQNPDDGWNLKQVDETFIDRTPSSENVFGDLVEKKAENAGEVDWPSYHKEDWGMPTPSGKTQGETGTDLRTTVSPGKTSTSEQRNTIHRVQGEPPRANTATSASMGSRAKSKAHASVPSMRGESGSASRSIVASLVSIGKEQASATTATDSDASPLPTMPSPFDKNYDAIMASRHQMLLSRKRAHQRRLASRTGTKTAEPGKAASSSAAAGTTTGFFGRTNPTASASAPVASPAPRVSHPPAPTPVEQHPRTTTVVENNVTPEHYDYGPQRPKKKPASSTPPAGSTSMLSKFTGSLGLSNDGTSSRREALVARLKSVKAARLRRAARMNAATHEEPEASNTPAEPRLGHQRQLSPPGKRATVRASMTEDSSNHWMEDMLEVD
eukprot:Nitzschia sp. Nitz4//scaffold44_size153857//144039//148898//NITZ4_002750-RA/size153857-processed-gene-0.173-mRNA-1//-1//CDS//3329552244//7669//frame0